MPNNDKLALQNALGGLVTRSVRLRDMGKQDRPYGPDLAKDTADPFMVVVVENTQQASTFIPSQQDARPSCRSLRR